MTRRSTPQDTFYSSLSVCVSFDTITEPQFNLVDRGRIELPSLRCKRSIIPSILTAQIWRGLSFAMTVCHATRLLSVMPPRNTTYSVRPPYCCHSDTHTDKLSHCRDVFCFLFLTVRCNIEGHTQSMAGVVGIEPTTE